MSIHRSKSKKSTKSTKKISKKGIKSYKTHDNGGRPFEVVVYPSKIEVFRLSEKENKKIFTSNYKKIFLGDKPKGNSILILNNYGKYTYIGTEIYSFRTRDGEKIKQYYSPVGNSDVPYPYSEKC
jgi:hypothetical protein